MKVNSAKELMDHQGLNRLRESDKVKDIQLEKRLIDVAEVPSDILLKVLGVQEFGHHIEPTPQLLRSIIVIIPHSSLRFSLEPLVATSVMPLMKAVRVLLLKATPHVDMS
jgi:hypothetical protein